MIIDQKLDLVITFPVVNPSPGDKKLERFLLIFSLLLSASPTNKRLEQNKHFVNAWRLGEYADDGDPQATEDFSALRTDWAFVNYDAADNVVVVHPYGQPQKTIRVAVPWRSDGETVCHMLRYFGFRSVFTDPQDQHAAELLRPYSQHSVVYISNPDSCSAPICDTFVVVMMSQWDK